MSDDRRLRSENMVAAVTAGGVPPVMGGSGQPAATHEPPTPQAARPVPEWFAGARFGIFVHWGPFAVPAYAPPWPGRFDLSQAMATDGWIGRTPYTEWYQNSLSVAGSPVAQHHAEVYGTQPYHDFAAEFVRRSASFDASVWADLFARAGARYVVLVTKHHDGWLLWPSEHRNPYQPDWQSERDLVGELAQAVRDRGLRFGVYYSGGLDWTFGGLGMNTVSDMIAAIPRSDEYKSYIDAHFRELIQRYEPSVLWNDIHHPAPADALRLFADYYRAVPDGVVNDRFNMTAVRAGQFPADFLTVEYSAGADTAGNMWEECRGLGNSFGYNHVEPEDGMLSRDELVALIAKTASGGGNLLLNVGPTADGTIPFAQAERLLAAGWWLETNREAICDTTPWTIPVGSTQAGEVVHYTARGDAVYAIVLAPSAAQHLVLTGIEAVPGTDVGLLGRDEPLETESAPEGLLVHLPDRPARPPAIVLKITPRPAPTSRAKPRTHDQS